MSSPSAGRKRVSTFLSVSLLLHVHFALMIAAVLAVNPKGCSADDALLEPIEIALVPATAEPPELKPEDLEKEEEQEEKKEQNPEGQVVELPPPLEERRPEEARFRSEYDSSVKRETKAKPQPFKPGKVVTEQRLPSPQQKVSPQQRDQVERKLMKLAMRRPKTPDSELPPAKHGDTAQPAPKASADGANSAESSAQKKQLTLKDLNLSQAELAKAVGSRVNDHIEDVEDGKQTLLNSRRWRFASFFNRVKRQVAQNWHPDRVYRRRDPQGNVYGFRDRLTVLRIRLTPAGELKDLHVEKASGVGFLDDEAIAAFRAAEPFPNPPKGLVDKDTGTISFRFGFLFEISRRPTFRLFRFNN